MAHPDPPKPIVVGIDGSQAAVNAARWAIDEAVSRDVALRLVNVMNIPNPARRLTDDDFRLELEYAESSLRAARKAVDDSGTTVKVETALLRGDTVTALAEESLNAAMICVGSVGIGFVARHVLGSTAAALAKKAHCPVAIIRTGLNSGPAHTGLLAVLVDDSPENDAVLWHAFAEARLRNTSVLALCVFSPGPGEIPYEELDRHLASWVDKYPEVNVRPVAARSGFAHYLATHDEAVQLAVLGTADAGQVPPIIGPHHPAVLPHPECSVLVVHE